MNPHTPYQLAKAHCANWDNGACKGIEIADDGSLFRFQSPRTCLLGNSKDRCAYFEECVMPHRKWVSNEKEKAAFLDGILDYRRRTGVSGSLDRPDPPDFNTDSLGFLNQITPARYGDLAGRERAIKTPQRAFKRADRNRGNPVAARVEQEG